MEQPDRDPSATDQSVDESFTPQAVRSAVGRWSVDRYITLIRWPLLLVGAVVILLVLFRAHQTIITAVLAGTCLWVGALTHRRRGQRTEALTAGVMIGTGLGFVAGVSRFALEPSGYWFINIFFETIVFGFVGALLSLGLHAVFHLYKHSSV